MPTEMLCHRSVITIQDHILLVSVSILDASDVVKNLKQLDTIYLTLLTSWQLCHRGLLKMKISCKNLPNHPSKETIGHYRARNLENHSVS